MVSDEQIRLMVDIYREKSAPGNTHSLETIFKAALEAVFDHIKDNLEKVEPEDTRDAKWNKCKKEILDAAKEAHYKKAYNDYLDLNDVPQNPNRIKPNTVKPEKKTYKLSDMWKVWRRSWKGEVSTVIYMDWPLGGVQDLVKGAYGVVAITPADATEFYEGEGTSEYTEQK